MHMKKTVEKFKIFFNNFSPNWCIVVLGFRCRKIRNYRECLCYEEEMESDGAAFEPVLVLGACAPANGGTDKEDTTGAGAEQEETVDEGPAYQAKLDVIDPAATGTPRDLPGEGILHLHYREER